MRLHDPTLNQMLVSARSRCYVLGKMSENTQIIVGEGHVGME